MEPFLGQLALFGFNFAPRGWALCEGQLLPIASYSALFSLLGNTYGGDGKTTFALPDLRGRAAIAFGQGPGLPNHVIGSRGGTPSVTLTTSNMPSHTHALEASSSTGNTGSPTGAVLAATPTTTPPSGPYATGGAPNTTLSAGAVSTVGGNAPVQTQSPYLTLNWCIALQGVFPPRS